MSAAPRPDPPNRIAVIGVGNDFRRDDVIGPALVAVLADDPPPGVALIVSDGEPTQLLDAWSGMDLAIVVDAVRCDPSSPGKVHRTTTEATMRYSGAGSTHGFGMPDAIRLAAVLGRAPARLVVYAVEAGDLGFGSGLSVEVARSLPDLTRAVRRELVCR